MVIAVLVFGFVFGSALFGMFLQVKTPERHLSQDSKDAVRLAMGVIATMAALVLGLLIASAKSSFDIQNQEVQQTAANVIRLDRALANYGPETKVLREQLRYALSQLGQ